MIVKEQLESEKNHLKDVYGQICERISAIELNINEAESALREHFSYKEDNIYSMDMEEETSTDLYYQNLQVAVDVLKRHLEVLKRLKKSVYFGSFKFTSDQGFNNVYVGATGFLGKGSYPLVCDWRAPISSMYYDYELGSAEYISAEGKISGEILSKRQYKVAEDELLYAFDSSLTIGDEVLKKELASANGEHMKNIVATIQKEQNKIIRDSRFKNMLIQGVAGSGKTSIALHRAAYLLYSMREKLNAENILVVSISDLFSKYIETVLPELGENSIKSITFDDIAKLELHGFIFESAAEMNERIVLDKNSLSDYVYKNSFEYLENLKKFLIEYDREFFAPKDIKLGREIFSKESIEKLYFEKFARLNPAERIGNICDFVQEVLGIPNAARDRVLTILYSMFNFEHFVDILEKFEAKSEKIAYKMQKIIKNNKILIKNDDLAAVLYLANYFYGLEKRSEVKLLIVDEFQEYSPIHFELLKNICDATWLVVGDINQCIHKNLSSEYLNNFAKTFELNEVVYLTKSYRMTNEIANFSKKIKNVESENFDRSGEAIEIINQSNLKDDLLKIISCSHFDNLAILVKSESEAKEIANLFDVNSVSLNKIEKGKTTVASYNYVKGIEFDHVIIPNVNQENFVGQVDKNILYNLATRATNKLTILSSKLPDFLN